MTHMHMEYLLVPSVEPSWGKEFSTFCLLFPIFYLFSCSSYFLFNYRLTFLVPLLQSSDNGDCLDKG